MDTEDTRTEVTQKEEVRVSETVAPRPAVADPIVDESAADIATGKVAVAATDSVGGQVDAATPNEKPDRTDAGSRASRPGRRDGAPQRGGAGRDRPAYNDRRPERGGEGRPDRGAEARQERAERAEPERATKPFILEVLGSAAKEIDAKLRAQLTGSIVLHIAPSGPNVSTGDQYLFSWKTDGDVVRHLGAGTANAPATVDSTPDCVISLSEDSFSRIRSGELNPQIGMLTDKIKVKGNSSLAIYFFNLLPGERD